MRIGRHAAGQVGAPAGDHVRRDWQPKRRSGSDLPTCMLDAARTKGVQRKLATDSRQIREMQAGFPAVQKRSIQFQDELLTGSGTGVPRP